MRVTDFPLLRRFWYCVGRSSSLVDKPMAFRLLGEPIVLWRDKSGAPRAVKDRCLHRTAKLSLGYVENGNLTCGYHGWAFDGDGHCIKVPQAVPEKPIPFGVPAHRCTERYNHLWVALEEPLYDIPTIPTYGLPGYRQVIEFCEVWAANPLRIVENSFDAAHITFVHKNTFGNPDPTVPPSTIEETDDGFIFRNDYEVVNQEDMKGALSMSDDRTVRRTENRYFVPFNRLGNIVYPNGLENMLCTFLTPIADDKTLFVQWVMRNDTEAQVPAEEVIAFDRRVTIEDRDIMESTDLNVPLDASEGREVSMVSDRPGLVMRKRLRALASEPRTKGRQ